MEGGRTIVKTADMEEGGRGIKKLEKHDDVFYGWSLMTVSPFTFCFLQKFPDLRRDQMENDYIIVL